MRSWNFWIMTLSIVGFISVLAWRSEMPSKNMVKCLVTVVSLDDKKGSACLEITLVTPDGDLNLGSTNVQKGDTLTVELPVGGARN